MIADLAAGAMAMFQAVGRAVLMIGAVLLRW